MKAHGGVELYTPDILNLGISGGKWSASSPGRFTSKERDPSTSRIEG